MSASALVEHVLAEYVDRPVERRVAQSISPTAFARLKEMVHDREAQALKIYEKGFHWGLDVLDSLTWDQIELIPSASMSYFENEYEYEKAATLTREQIEEGRIPSNPHQELTPFQQLMWVLESSDWLSKKRTEELLESVDKNSNLFQRGAGDALSYLETLVKQNLGEILSKRSGTGHGGYGESLPDGSGSGAGYGFPDSSGFGDGNFIAEEAAPGHEGPDQPDLPDSGKQKKGARRKRR